MNQNQIQMKELLEKTRCEIEKVRSSSSGKKTTKFPSHIWENIKLLANGYSRSKLTNELSVNSSQISKALGRIGLSKRSIHKEVRSKSSSKVCRASSRFIEMKSSLPALTPTITLPREPELLSVHSIAPLKKLILELRTASGTTISIFE